VDSELTTERVIGITGSIGKSTITTVLGLALNKVASCFFGGNLGEPLAQYGCRILKGEPRTKFVVLELSSYQLELFRNLECEISIFSYLTPNHLDRYPSLEDYYRTKWSLAEKTKKLVICNPSGGDLKAFVPRAAMIRAELAWPKPEDFLGFPFDKVKMLGAYQKQNLSLVLAACRALEIPQDIISQDITEVLTEFPGLPHRMENLGYKNGVLFINDSKATTVPSVLEACQAVLEKLGPGAILHLLVGGRDKNLNWEVLTSLNAHKDRLRIYFFGEARQIIQSSSKLPGYSFLKMSAAVQAAKSQAKEQDVILLSPGGTSHDEFSSFEDRGNQFKKLVEI
jgi:UDP-N-acetylmuramoylalanine--D-glutamate ligase